MRYIFYILGAIFVYLIIGKVAEAIYFSVFPYNLTTVPGDMLMTDFSVGLFRRQIWVHFAVAVIYVFLLGEKQDWLIYAAVSCLFVSFNDVDTSFSILANVACISPMIVASWVVASQDSAKANYKRKAEAKRAAEPKPVEISSQQGATRIAERLKTEITMGRSESCDIVLPSTCSLVSRNHATIKYENGRFSFTDHSSNGSLINGVLLHDHSIYINENDTIQMPGGEAISWDKIKTILKQNEKHGTI